MSEWVQPQRTLVREMLFSQLAFAALVGVIAIGCIWWVSNWVIRDNLDDWATRWIGEMESLGAGFYIDPSDERFLELENYLSRFPEIEYVRYYDLDGAVIYIESALQQPSTYPVLNAEQLMMLNSIADEPVKHAMSLGQEPLVRISQSVVTEAIVSANLLTAQSLSELETRTTVVGFVELGLDYSAYDRDLFGSIFAGGSFVVLAFLVLTLAGRIALRRAIQPLVDMQLPLDRIAQGDLDVAVPSSVYREISVVSRALETALETIRIRDKNLRKLANFDPLTGLASRYHFLDLLGAKLNELEHNASTGALLFIDLDQFKYVNDTHGHQAGDAVLAQVTQRLRQVIYGDDLIGRFGGDEFVVFVADVTADFSTAIAEKLMRDMREYPPSFDGVSFGITYSVGIAMATQMSVYAPEELISQADFACRQAKSQGRNRVHHFRADAGELETIRGDLQWQQKLQAALQNDTLVLHYQPIMNVADGSVEHYEVLLRMEEGDQLHFPDTFLPAAMRFGLMQEVDHWVICKAFEVLADLRERREEVKFSINISGNAFTDGSLVEFVKSQLTKCQLDASAVIFEITEQVAIGSMSEASPQILELTGLGFEFAVDDFGTGYSSLSYLKKLPVQYIKIDGAFIQRITMNQADQTIVRAIADIARIMNKRTVAEFVGDERTLALIREIGIDYAQGFYIGEPLAVLSPTHNTVVPLRRSGTQISATR